MTHASTIVPHSPLFVLNMHGIEGSQKWGHCLFLSLLEGDVGAGAEVGGDEGKSKE